VGRAGELARVGGLVSGVGGGVGGVLLVVGEQGIGKSALLREGLSGAVGLGCRVGWGVADELRQGFPLAVMVECLGSEGRLAVAGGGVAGVGVADYGPSLAGPVLAGDPVLAGGERLLGLVDRLCAVSPVVVTAEDLQWADEASLVVWRRLARAVGQVPLLVVGSVRPVPGRDDLAGLVRGVAAGGGVVVELGPLAGGEVAELASGLVGGRPGRRLAGVLGRAGGNPLYVAELAGALVRDGRVVVAGGVAELAGEPGGVPVSLAAAIGERLAGLAPEAVGVLRWAAVLGSEFSVADLGLVTAWPAGELAPVMEAAVAAGVVASAGPRLGFRHGLIRQVLYEGVPGPVREALHVQAARALAGAGAPVERVAAQLVAAPQADEDWVWGWLTGAAPVLAYRAPQVAAELLRRAVGQVAEADPRREVLEAALVQVASLLVLYDEVERVARPLLTRTTDPDRAGDVAWLLACTLTLTGRPAEAAAVAEAALARPGISQTWAVRLRAWQAVTLTMLGQWDRAAELAEQALAGAEQAGDRLGAGWALHALSIVAYHQRSDRAGLLGYLDRALAVIGDDPQATNLRLQLLANRTVMLGDLDRHAEADATIRQALDLAERTGNARHRLLCAIAAEFYLETGQWDDALTVLEAAAGMPAGHYFRVLVHGQAALIAGHRDDWDTVDEHLAAVPDEALGSAQYRAFADRLFLARALAAERAGRPGEAVAVLARCLDPAVAEDMTDQYLLLPALTRLALAAGDAVTAAAAARAAADEAERDPVPAKTAAARHCRGLADGDPAPVLAVAAYHQSAGRPPRGAQALEDAAVLLAGRGDLPAARRAFSDAVGIYAGLGAAWDLRRADARLRPYGIRRGRAGRRAPATHGWDALTPTETKVARLVAAGRSNPDIAAELFLSRNTVQTHVSHILAKLGARSRAEIIRQALEQGGGARTAR
jgi:DNA-binding CsgD family transcriptional regulator